MFAGEVVVDYALQLQQALRHFSTSHVEKIRRYFEQRMQLQHQASRVITWW
jgi:hypothetical protein